jgi:chromosome segregation ATPase
MIMTEFEMKEFFQRVVDEVATLSTQASKVEGLQEQVNSLTDRLNALEQENRRLQDQAIDASNIVARMEAEITSTRSALESEHGVVSALRETLVQRDAGVVELQNQLSTERDAHKITTSERDDARQKVIEVQRDLDGTSQRLHDVTTDRDEWRSKANELERQAHDLRSQLDRINSVLNPLRAVPSADVA